MTPFFILELLKILPEDLQNIMPVKTGSQKDIFPGKLFTMKNLTMPFLQEKEKNILSLLPEEGLLKSH